MSNRKPLEPDIVRWIKEKFSPQNSDAVVELLEMRGYSGRVARCIVFAAHGDLRRIRDLIRLTEQDERDVIVTGEYEGMDRRVRDFSASFLVDAPEKMWIASIANWMQHRGYSLISIETTPTGSSSPNFLSELGKGMAIFEGDPGPIVIVKRRGLWSTRGKLPDLALHGLDREFADEGKFSNAILSYIQARRNPLPVQRVQS